MSIEKKYDSNLLKGTGLIEETLVLLEAYEKGISKEAFYKKVFELDLLSKSTENRVNDIIKRVFFKRYWKQDVDVASALQKLRRNYVSIEVLRQLFYIYTSRANPILRDFLIHAVFPFQAKGYQKLLPEDARNFIQESIKDGRVDPPWSEETVLRVGRHLLACLTDFNIIDKENNLLPIQLFEITANYLAHELHFRGYSDNQILQHPDWKLFQLTDNEVVGILQRVSWQGHFIVQYSGEILNISWKYNSMEQFIDGLSNK